MFMNYEEKNKMGFYETLKSRQLIVLTVLQKKNPLKSY